MNDVVVVVLDVEAMVWLASMPAPCSKCLTILPGDEMTLLSDGKSICDRCISRKSS